MSQYTKTQFKFWDVSDGLDEQFLLSAATLLTSWTPSSQSISFFGSSGHDEEWGLQTIKLPSVMTHEGFCSDCSIICAISPVLEIIIPRSCRVRWNWIEQNQNWTEINNPHIEWLVTAGWTKLYWVAKWWKRYKKHQDDKIVTFKYDPLADFEILKIDL